MHVMLQILTTVPPKSSVPDVVFATVGAIAGALEDDFVKYMDPFTPFLYNALGNLEEPGLCSMAIGLVSDIARALNEKVQPYCDTFMNYLLTDLSVSPAHDFARKNATLTSITERIQPVEARHPRVLR